MNKQIAVVGLVGLLALPGCEFLKTLPVYDTVTDPRVDPGDKTCAVLEWAIPLVESRLGTLGPRGIQVLEGAKQVAAAGCRLDDATWRARAIAAGIELTRVLWGFTR